MHFQHWLAGSEKFSQQMFGCNCIILALVVNPGPSYHCGGRHDGWDVWSWIRSRLTALLLFITWSSGTSSAQLATHSEHYCSDIICGPWLNTRLSISRLLTFSVLLVSGLSFNSLTTHDHAEIVEPSLITERRSPGVFQKMHQSSILHLIADKKILCFN